MGTIKFQKENEHHLNMVFDYDSYGAANKFLNEHIYYSCNSFGLNLGLSYPKGKSFP